MSELQSDNYSSWEIFKNAGFTGKLALALSTWFGSGLLPRAPGTFGTVAAIPVVLGMNCLGVWPALVFLIAFTFGAVWSSQVSRRLLGPTDPSEVVIDEVAGFLLTMLFLPHSRTILFAGFILFRFFDIIKPYPIKRIERLKGGYGIVMDDMMAGLYAHMGLRIIICFTGS